MLLIRFRWSQGSVSTRTERLPNKNGLKLYETLTALDNCLQMYLMNGSSVVNLQSYCQKIFKRARAHQCYRSTVNGTYNFWIKKYEDQLLSEYSGWTAIASHLGIHQKRSLF